MMAASYGRKGGEDGGGARGFRSSQDMASDKRAFLEALSRSMAMVPGASAQGQLFYGRMNDILPDLFICTPLALARTAFELLVAGPARCWRADTSWIRGGGGGW